MNSQQLTYYEEKLKYEMDSADAYEALQNGSEIVIVDGRASFAYEKEHIPLAINLPHRNISKESNA